MSWLVVDVAFWGVLVAVWVAAAPFARRTVRRERVTQRMQYVGIGIVAGVLMSPAFPVTWFHTRWIPATAPFGILAVTLTAVGVAFAIWARFTLGRNWSGTVTLKEDHELVQRGPYRLSRHPIYTGVGLAFSGTAVALGTPGALIALPLMVLAFCRKMAIEERFMTEHFGGAYDAYRRRVKGLIPFVW